MRQLASDSGTIIRRYGLHRPFFGLLAGWIVGVATGLFFVWLGVGWVAMACGLSMLSVWYRERRGWLVVCFFMAFGFGTLFAQGAMEKWKSSILPEYKVQGEATIVREPQVGERSLKAVVRFVQCETRCPEVLVMTTLPLHTEAEYGERLFMECELKTSQVQEGEVDYRMLLAKDGIGYTCFPKHWEKRGDGEGGFMQRLMRVRRVFESGLNQSVPQPESALAAGLLFGGDDRLTEVLRERFAATGMTHIVAVSGSNVALVMEWLMIVSLALGLWRKQALWVALGGVVVFVAMVGAEASAVRAGIMGALTIVALRSGRMSSGIRALVFAAAVMLAYNPLLLRYDLGFQLSFLATLGILTLLSLRRESGESQSDWKDILWMTLAAELFVLPIVAFTFHTVPLVSLAANMLILPAIPLAMLAALATALLGVVAPVSAWISGWVTYAITHYMITAVALLSNQSWSTVALPSFGFGWVIGWYALVTLGYMAMKRRSLYNPEYMAILPQGKHSKTCKVTFGTHGH